MNPQTIKDIKALSTVEPEQIRKYDRMNVVVKFMEAKNAHPDFNKLQLCKSIGVSDSYLKRVMKDLDIPSFYRHEIPVNNKNKNKKLIKADENIEENTKPSTSKQKIKKNNKNSKSEEITDEYIRKLTSNA